MNADLAAQLRANKQPVAQASVLPPHCYTSPEWYDGEVRRIFMKEWLLVGREDKLARNGDYFTMEIASEPIVVVRDHKGEVRAFLNVCRHRMAKIATGAGNARTFVCSYHCWTYGLDGKLMLVPGPSPMAGAENFDQKKYGLVSLKVATWGGFVFINFSEAAPPLMEWLGGLPAFLRNYRLHEMTVHRELQFDVGINWKVFVENTMESYHAGFVHGKFLDPNVDQQWKFLESDGPYNAMYSDKSIMDFGNLPPIQGLDDRQKAGLFHIWLNPNTTIHVASTYMTYRRYIPRGPEKMRIYYQWCFLPETMAHPDFKAVEERYYRQSEEILSQDIDFLPRVQEGLGSMLARPGRYSPTEYIVHKLANYVIDKVAGPLGQPALAAGNR